MLHHKVRIWKFLPRQYRLDEGWQNKHLDKYGQYKAPLVGPHVYSVDPGTAGADGLDDPTYDD